MAVIYFRCLNCGVKTPAETEVGVFVCPMCLSRFDIKKVPIPPKKNKYLSDIEREQPKIPFPMRYQKGVSAYCTAPSYGGDVKTLPNYKRRR